LTGTGDDDSSLVLRFQAGDALEGQVINPGRASWHAAMVYPKAHSPHLTLTDAQRDALRLLAPLAAN
jgi:hypothetical protein